MLDRVTITGADDKVNPSDLAALSKEFPFVEWGILFSPSPSRMGTPRYPTGGWLVDLCDFVDDPSTPHMNFSAHLCGGFAKHAMVDGDPEWFRLQCAYLFSRVQFNGFSVYRDHMSDKFLPMLEQHDGYSYVMQIADDDALKAADLLTVDPDLRERMHVLFDASAGRGIQTQAWSAPATSLYVGYAGGLNPDNLRVNLTILEAVAGNRPFSIDMETGVRTDDVFDLEKVRKVLELARLYLPEDVYA